MTPQEKLIQEVARTLQQLDTGEKPSTPGYKYFLDAEVLYESGFLASELPDHFSGSDGSV